jgi:phosphatidate cytidylyltransferase
MHLRRILTAFIIIPALYFYVMKLPAQYFTALMIIVSASAQWEFYSMYGVRAVFKLSGVLLGTAVLLAGRGLSDIFIVSFMAASVSRLFLVKDPSSALKDISPVLIGLLYIPGLLLYQIELRSKGPEWIIFFWAMIWMADSAAYYIGKGIGRRRLYKEVSPHKTVAGGVASVFGGALGALMINALLMSDFPYQKSALIGMAIGAVSVAGDLIESMFKRDAGVKDSSSVIPGHGGVLDKIDSALFAGPALFWLLKNH